MATDSGDIRHRLALLAEQLDRVNSNWSRENYHRLIDFYVQIVPAWMGAERCSVFVREPGSRQVWVSAGTGIDEREIEVPLEGSIVGHTIASGQGVVVNAPQQHPLFHADTDKHTGFETRNMVCVPVISPSGRGICGAIQILNSVGRKGFDELDLKRLEEVAHAVSILVDNLLLNQEMLTLSQSLSGELDRVWSGFLGDVSLVAQSSAMRNLMDMVKAVSATPVDVHLNGENGTGKEVIAKLLHRASDRAAGPFVAVNCAAIPAELVENEFFGYAKGAVGGAKKARPGHFEAASGGILFLDEIGELTAGMQARLLRVLQERQGKRVGDDTTVTYNFRLITANNRDLRPLVEQGRFLEELFYRLFAVELEVPPLRRRRDDIIPLARHFLQETARRFNRPLPEFQPATLRRFEDYSWPGNVRQLRHEVERMMALAGDAAELGPHLCSAEILASTAQDKTIGLVQGDLSLPARVAELEVRLLKQALAEANGNKVRAARLLGITRQGLYKKIQRYRIDEKEGTAGEAIYAS